jgi:23S rRNA (cytosine1962-C5)-methyltransferase
MRVKPTDFGHLGIFPEQIQFWNILKGLPSSLRVLNLFAYSGGSTLACAKKGMNVCHLDASKGMCEWARGNALLNNLQDAPIRWIVEDVMKFLQREVKRASTYDGIILDPPSFGRGSKSEVFKIEDDIIKLLSLCRSCLSSTPSFILFSCHTPGFTPLTLNHLLAQMMDGIPGSIEHGEMVLSGNSHILPVPSGSFALWKHNS